LVRLRNRHFQAASLVFAGCAVRERQLREEVTQLNEYRVIPDANLYAQQVRTTADTEVQVQLTRARQEADALRTAATSEAQELVSNARREAGDLRAA
nr:hypothetical protein [Tanacetum cinerariifolium]